MLTQTTQSDATLRTSTKRLRIRRTTNLGDVAATYQIPCPVCLLTVVILLALLMPAAIAAVEKPLFPTNSATPAQLPSKHGPTLRLDYAREHSAGNPVGAFMYFVPLISPDPVTTITSTNSTLTAHVTSAQRRFTADAFTVKCDFQISGLGSHQSQFDLSPLIQQRERKLKDGGVLHRQLTSITVEGAGSGQVEVEGTITNGVQTVTQVRLRFNARGKTSPVGIGLCDVRYEDGEYQHVNEIVARVNTLTFLRKPGPPTMEVTVAAVKRKGAGNSIWQSLKAGVKGVVANLLIPPLGVQANGHQAILDFGQALVAGAPAFTFPYATNLQSGLGR